MAKKTEVKEEVKLPFDELFAASGDSLPVFVGTIVNMGLQLKYDASVEAHKKGEVLEPIISIEEYKKGRQVFLNKKI